jgi:predicted transcriptional regulator
MGITGYTPVMKTAVSIPDDVFKKAEYLAKKRGLSRSQFYVMAIKAFISEPDDDITRALNDLYGEQDAPDPVIERAALSDLPPSGW